MMSDVEIDIAAEGCVEHPVLGPATRFLKAFKDSVNEQSDGWTYWHLASRAAKKLQELITENTGTWGQPKEEGGFGNPDASTQITLKDVEKAIQPIKRMVDTQKRVQKEKYGNDFDFDYEQAWAEASGNA